MCFMHSRFGVLIFMVKSCFVDGYECLYSSCSFLQDGVVRLCHRYRGNPSAFCMKPVVGRSVTPVFGNKHLRGDLSVSRRRA